MRWRRGAALRTPEVFRFCHWPRLTPRRQVPRLPAASPPRLTPHRGGDAEVLTGAAPAATAAVVAERPSRGGAPIALCRMGCER
jgi:hypothetical protein